MGTIKVCAFIILSSARMVAQADSPVPCISITAKAIISFSGQYIVRLDNPQRCYGDKVDQSANIKIYARDADADNYRLHIDAALPIESVRAYVGDNGILAAFSMKRPLGSSQELHIYDFKHGKIDELMQITLPRSHAIESLRSQLQEMKIRLSREMVQFKENQIWITDAVNCQLVIDLDNKELGYPPEFDQEASEEERARCGLSL